MLAGGGKNYSYATASQRLSFTENTVDIKTLEKKHHKYKKSWGKKR